MLAVFTVDSTADVGPGTLREAIDLANAAEGPDEIVFDQAVFSVPKVIAIDSQLPTITDGLTISGPGADLLKIDAQHGTDGEAATGDGWRVLESHAPGDMQVSLSGLTFANADHEGLGGAILNRGNLRIDSVVFAGNHVWGDGGAVYDAGVLEVTLSRFIDNTASRGGGLFTRGADVATTLFESNNAFRGGAIYAAGPAQLADSAIVSNTATYGAGAWITGRVAIEGVTVSGNRADEGAAFVFNGTGFGGSTVSQSTIVRNINLRSSSALGAAYSAAIGLDPPFLGGQGNRVLFTNSIVAETIDGNGDPTSDVTSGPFSFTHSLLGTGNTGLDGVDGNRIGGADRDRLLADIEPLGYYGGPTPTHPLRAGSPALDAGDPIIVANDHDQRGAPYQRVADGGGGLRIDMGAYESQAPPPVTRLGDFNADGSFDAADYTVWRDHLGSPVAPFTAADATGDGIVDDIDLQLWRHRYGERYVVGPDIVVNDLGDIDDGDIFNGVTTLREAIRFTNETDWADTITFDSALSGGVITLSQTRSGLVFTVNDDLVIDATELPDGITIEYGSDLGNGFFLGGPGSIFGVRDPNLPPGSTSQAASDAEIDLSIAGLIVRGGGGVIDGNTAGAVELHDVHLINGTPGPQGVVSNNGPIVFHDSKVSDVFDGRSGRPVLFSRHSVAFVRSEMRDIVTGAIELVVSSDAESPGAIVIEDSFFENTGRIWAEGGDVSIRNSTILSPTGGVTAYARAAGGGSAELVNSRVEGYVGESSQSVAVEGDSVTLIGSHVVNNNAVGVHGGNVTMIDSEVSGNVADTGVSVRSLNLLSGAGVAADEDVHLVRSTVRNNRIELDGSSPLSHGGGIAAGGRIEAIDSTISGNSASLGGGLYAWGIEPDGSIDTERAVVRLEGTTVSDNAASNAAAIWAAHRFDAVDSSISGNWLLVDSEQSCCVPTATVLISEAYGTATSVSNTVFAANTGPTNAWVLATEYRGEVDLDRVTVIDNTMNGVMATTVVDSTISRNTGVGLRVSERVEGTLISANFGGGVHAVGNSPGTWIADSTIRGNRSTYAFDGYGLPAAGVFSNYHVALVRTEVADNRLTVVPQWTFWREAGGGVAASSISATDSIIRGNAIIDSTTGPRDVDPYRGAGLHAIGTLSLYRSTVSGNHIESPGALGGGVAAWNVELSLSTISDNHAAGEGASGGGVAADTLTSVYSTIANNSAETEGGGARVAQTIDLEGTIIAGNVAPSGPDLHYQLVGDRVLNYSIIGDSSGFENDPSMGVGNLLDTDPLLGPLADNGGPTATHALLPSSPAIDAGDPGRLAVPDNYPVFIEGISDQRGEPFARVADGGSGAARIDIGAYELQPLTAQARTAWSPLAGFEANVEDETAEAIPDAESIIEPTSLPNATLLLIDTALTEAKEEPDESDLICDPLDEEREAAIDEIVAAL